MKAQWRELRYGWCKLGVNALFGNIHWTDGDRVRKLITEEIPQRVAADMAYQNAR